MPTDRYAVFGNPVGHSQSPRIHALFATQTGQDMQYEAILAAPDSFTATLRQFIASGAQGANVTLPFKEEAFRLATRLTPRAKAAGAVNTLSFRDDAIVGDNTDGAGLVRDIKDNLGCAIAGRRLLLLGAGGAARGVILPLMQERPDELLIVNRTEEKARRLVAEAAAGPLCKGGGYSALGDRQFDIIINATSTGLGTTALPVPVDTFAPGCLAYEMVYGRETPFMALARAAVLPQSPQSRIVDGLGMLVEQAAEAFLLWRGIRPDTAAVLAALRA